MLPLARLDARDTSAMVANNDGKGTLPVLGAGAPEEIRTPDPQIRSLALTLILLMISANRSYL
jgi:hypothetical protein